MDAGDVAVQLVWKLLWSWRKKPSSPSGKRGGGRLSNE